MNRWVEGYISAQQQPDSRTRNDELPWPIQKFFDLEMDHPDVCWDAILNILHREPNQKVLGNLAAGPLEDLIENHGDRFIKKIEEEARINRSFRHLLGGVWESGSEEVWNRVLRARKNVSW